MLDICWLKLHLLAYKMHTNCLGYIGDINSMLILHGTFMDFLIFPIRLFVITSNNVLTMPKLNNMPDHSLKLWQVRPINGISMTKLDYSTSISLIKEALLKLKYLFLHNITTPMVWMFNSLPQKTLNGLLMNQTILLLSK